jgi:hypothetical protein
MGTSCRIPQSARSGTLGGRIQLQKDSSILEMGLTSSFVLDGGLQQSGRLLDRPFAPDREATYGTVSSPSDSDHNAMVPIIPASIVEVKKDLSSICQKLELSSADHPAWGMMHREKDVLDRKRKWLERLLEVAENYPR